MKALTALLALLLVGVIAAEASAHGPSSELAARDELIADQENLLNTYRCMFDIDTELVPGGCGALPQQIGDWQLAGAENSDIFLYAVASAGVDDTSGAVGIGAILSIYCIVGDGLYVGIGTTLDVDGTVGYRHEFDGGQWRFSEWARDRSDTRTLLTAQPDTARDFIAYMTHHKTGILGIGLIWGPRPEQNYWAGFWINGVAEVYAIMSRRC